MIDQLAFRGSLELFFLVSTYNSLGFFFLNFVKLLDFGKAKKKEQKSQ